MKEITADLAREYNDLNFEDEDQLRSFFNYVVVGQTRLKITTFQQ